MVNSNRDFFEKNDLYLVLNNKEKEELVKKIFKKMNIKFNGYRNSFNNYLSRGLLKISDGCDFECSYCIITNVRGNYRPVPKKIILKRFKELLSLGYKEIIITGLNIAYDKTDKNNFKKVLKLLINEPGKFLLRLTSLDPRFLSDETVDFLVKEKKIAPHFHVSVQNGSKKILEKMNRKIKPNKLLEILNKLNRKPNVLIAADYIVGFPGETNSEFEKGYDFLKNSPINYLHIFRYSPRPGTPAFSMKHPTERLAKKRYEKLKKFHNKRYSIFKKKFAGRTLRGIYIKNDVVLTENYLKVIVGNNIEILNKGEMYNIRINKFDEDKLLGKVVKNDFDNQSYNY